MKKKILALALVVAMLAIAVVGGTLAYFTDKDFAENTMTIGNIDIVQNEYEYGPDGEFIPFTQDKPLFPYVGELGWKTNKSDNYRQFTMNNVIDKYVTVTNTGKNDAFVRTFIAMETSDTAPIEDSDEFIGISFNSASSNWNWEFEYIIELNGHKYYVCSAVHDKALAPGQESVPSLLQVYLDKTATQEDADRIDANDDGVYTIYALTQGVQEAGFESAEAALDEAFGDVTAANLQKWFAEAIA